MTRCKILYISQEITPYLPETPLSLLGRNLPQSVHETGYEVRTFMPKYGIINERRNQLHEVIRLSGMNVVIDDTDHPLIIKVATLPPTRMQVYFIDNDDFFYHSPAKELETISSAENNDERMIFFVRGTLETLKKLRWDPAVIHLTGWISSLAPLFIKRIYSDDPTFANAKIVYTLRNEKFDGTLDKRFVEKLSFLDLADEDLALLGTDPVDVDTLHKLAILHSDAVMVTSPDTSAELIEYAHSLGKPVYEKFDENYKECADFYSTLQD